ncbi:Dermonecrotic toxin LvSicTox-alphaIC1biii [Dirofilaria immitis]
MEAPTGPTPKVFNANHCDPLTRCGQHADSSSVARVQPWTSKGITDLLLLNFMRLNTACPSKKLSEQIIYIQ